MPLERTVPRAAAMIGTALVLVACAATKQRPATFAANGDVSVGAAATASADAPGTDDGDGPADEPASMDDAAPADACPENMVLVATEEAHFCIDKYEASLVEIDANGAEKPFPHWLPVDGHTVRAVSAPDVFPQGYISEVQAEDACAASNKRLCSHVEWKTACMGPAKTTFPYGDTRQPGACQDSGKSAVAAVFGARALTDPVAPSVVAANAKANKANKNGALAARPAQALKGRAAQSTRTRPTRKGSPSRSDESAARAKTASSKKTSPSSKPSRAGAKPAQASTRPASVTASVWAQLNDPRLGQVEGTLARTGSHQACMSGFGALDMMGNVHEWVKTDQSRVHGTFAGGYFLDTSINGNGCEYRTTAHAHDYHDYSTGFRCCADAAGD